MSITYPSRQNLASKTIQKTTTSAPWVRSPSWVTFTAPTSAEQKFVGLHAVWPDANFCALSAAGDYTVNWGDGLTENFTANTVAYHEYSFSDADLANTNGPVTFTDSGDLVNRTAHGYSNGMPVQFYNIATTTGITEGQIYYVISATANTFQIASTIGGSAVALTNDGSATLLPYKQAVVTLTMQSGQTLTVLNLHQKHNQSGLQAYDSGFLDIAISGGSLSDLRIGVATPGSTTQNIRFASLEQVNLVNSAVKDAGYLFYFCPSLTNIVNFSLNTSPASTLAVTFTDAGDVVNATAHGLNNGDAVTLQTLVTTTGLTVCGVYYVVNKTTDTFQVSSAYGGSALVLTSDGSGSFAVGNTLQYAFSACYSLTAVPLFNTSSVVNMASMFNSCSGLSSVPLFNTTSVITMAGLFNSCSGLSSVPLFNTASVISMTNMFNNCFWITSVPLLNTTAVTTMSSMFTNCRTLNSVPLFNTPSVTTMASMFSGCYRLASVPLFNTASVTDMNNMFNSCLRLTSVPLFNTAAVTNMSGMFSACYSLMSVPAFNTASVTAMASMFNACYSLASVPAINAGGATSASSYSSMFNSCNNISNIDATGFKYSFSVAICKLSADRLNEIYTNLATVTSQTITVTNNYGTTGDDPTIATAKGWTVTG
jgi:surface protein